MLRSSAFDSDWFTLGCTTSSAAIAANTGSCAGKTQPAISHAAIVAAADLTTCSSGERWEARIAAGMRMAPTLLGCTERIALDARIAPGSAAPSER